MILIQILEEGSTIGMYIERHNNTYTLVASHSYENIEKLEETNQYEELYNSIKDKLTNDLLNKNLIDDNSFGKIVLMLNDSFNFFISGYPDIPDEFLFNENDNN